ncbi:hypothetical protein GPAL_2318 [Glaciecola pallidula DSM 14239 = ACAM 615]|uniref:Uncharacterized protein n=1 Tax=Brumicola pallidula DSM 14239 = ACAM 615 TaxID=1121922 RepID=K6Y8U6_9ALTE|nr:hypothetical protein GPAL_2318 [Glaciecola pallidula DSM 14239 = ACAM 615]
MKASTLIKSLCDDIDVNYSTVICTPSEYCYTYSFEYYQADYDLRNR